MGSGKEVENVKSLWTDDGRRTPDDGQTDGRTDDGQCALTIAHLSLRLRWAKKEKILLNSMIKAPTPTEKSKKQRDKIKKTLQ